MFLDCTGSISWWLGFYAEGKGRIEVNHSFQRQSPLSQLKLVGPNGLLPLSIPTKKVSRKGPYAQVLISYGEDWVGDLIKSMESAYSKSPFYMYYEHKLNAILNQKPERLLDLNLHLLEFCLKALRWPGQVKIDEVSIKNYETCNRWKYKSYPQVFDDKIGFVPELSVLDLVFNLGPESGDYLSSSSTKS